MTLLDQIYIAQRDAGESTVIANLKRKGWVTTDIDTITRLQGEAKVLLILLAKALDVLYTIDPECATEHETLEDLTDQIEAVLKSRPI